ncbi:MAG: helix-turn-helix domain-containing protein [Desulfomonile tiedjei]|uniref:Helix-turn-helix domain-containing protein n=1 Tax=Desulfomonile tiedjei TaxID=2358 RepID=A0A9D6V375_9BACT|nr:helix-turn-helix domain-containing protein [Desulfomonile tiedjei]
MTNNESRKENDQERIPIRKLLSAKDVADILGISVKTVHKFVRDGKLGCVQVTAKERRFTEEQVRAYIEAQSRRPEEVRIDTTRTRRVSSEPEKGGKKSSRVFDRANLLKEMRSWQ